MTLRIVKKPTKVLPKLGEHGTNTTHPILIISCSDGCDYTLQQLAEKVGMSRQRISHQIHVMGWRHPKVLSQPEKVGSSGKGDSKSRAIHGNAAWHSLSDQSRFAKMPKVPMGSLEQRDAQLTRERA